MTSLRFGDIDTGNVISSGYVSLSNPPVGSIPLNDAHLTTKAYITPLYTFKSDHQDTLDNISYALSISAPELLDSNDPGGVHMTVVKYAGTNYVYCSTGGSGIAIFDVETPSNVIFIGFYDVLGTDNAIALKDNVLYSASAGSGLGWHSLANPAIPSFISSEDLGGTYNTVSVWGNYLYVGSGTDVYIYDITTANSPVYQSTIATGTGTVAGIAVDGNVMYVTKGGQGCYVYDVTNKAAVINYGGGGTVSFYSGTGTYEHIAIDTIATVKYGFVSANGTGRWDIYDLTDPGAAVFKLTEVNPSGSPSHTLLISSGTSWYAIVSAAGGGMHVYNVTDPLVPVFVNTQDPGVIEYTAIEGTKLYAAGGGSGMHVYDVGAKIVIDRLETTGTDPSSVKIAGGVKILKTLDITGVSIDAVRREKGEPSGFPNITDSVLSFVDGTRTFTIAPAVTSFNVYVQAVLYTKTSADTVVIADVEGEHVIYYDAGGILKSSTTFHEFAYTIVAAVYWDATNKTAIILEEGRHGMIMSDATLHFFHDSFSTTHEYGLALENITIGDGSLLSHVQFGLTSGKIYSTDLSLTLVDGTPQDLSPALNASVFYRTGPGYWRKFAASTTPVYATGGVAQRNAEAAGTFSLAPVTDGYYIVYTVMFTFDLTYPVRLHMGRNEYATLADAKMAIGDEMNYVSDDPYMHHIEMAPIGCVIYQCDSAYANVAKSRLVSIDATHDWYDTRDILTHRSMRSIPHYSLSGRINDEHIQYALLAGRTGDILKIDTINEFTTNAGITAEGILLKDSGIGDAFVTTTLAIGQADEGIDGGTVGTTLSTDTRATSLVGAINESKLWQRSYNGLVTHDFNFTVTSDGVTITISYSSQVGNTQYFKFLNGIVKLDTTTPVTTTLSPGTDTTPIEYWIYFVPTGGSPPTGVTLTTNSSSYPTGSEYSAVARVLVQSAASIQTYGAYKIHKYTDHISYQDGSQETGHILHIGRWIREQPATWGNGTNLTYTGSGTNNVAVAISSGQIYQLHIQSWPVIASPARFWVVNHVTPYTTYLNIHDITADSTGTTLNGKDFSLVFWGSINANGQSKLYVNLPSGSYGNISAATADASKYTDFGIPSEFRGTGFLLRRLVCSRNGAGTTTTVDVDIDLRGLKPNVDAGSSVATAQTFADDIFSIYDQTDNTKEIAFQASNITTATTRTITMPDTDVTLQSVGIADTPTFVGVLTNSVDRSTAGTLTIGATTATAVDIGATTYGSLVNGFFTVGTARISVPGITNPQAGRIEIVGNWDGQGGDMSSILFFNTGAGEANTTYPNMWVGYKGHDNTGIIFDGYVDDSLVDKSSDAGSNFMIHKTGDKLAFKGSFGNVVGNTVTYASIMDMDSTLVRIFNTTASASSGTGALLMSGGIGISLTTDATSASNGGTFTTAGGLAVAKKAYVGTDLYVGGDTYMTGNLTVLGTTTTVDSTTVSVTDSHIYINKDYTTASGKTGGLVVNYLPTATSTTTAGAGVFVSGVAPTVTTSTTVFSAGDIIQISGAADAGNNGIFEVASHVAGLLTIRGSGSVVEDFTQTNFTNNVGDTGATITKVGVSVMRAGTDGIWETGYGNTTGILFTNIGAGGGGGILTNPQIYDTSLTNTYDFAVNELTANRTITLPLLTGNDTFVFEAHGQTLTNKTMSTGSSWLGSAVGETYGGTGQTSYAQYDMLYASALNTLSKLTTVASRVLTTSAGGLPQWTNTLPTLASITIDNITINGTAITSTTSIEVTPTTSLSLGGGTGDVTLYTTTGANVNLGYTSTGASNTYIGAGTTGDTIIKSKTGRKISFTNNADAEIASLSDAGALVLSSTLTLGGNTVGAWNSAALANGTGISSIAGSCYYYVVYKVVTARFDITFTATATGSTATFTFASGIAAIGAKGNFANAALIENTSVAAFTPGRLLIAAGATSPITVTMQGNFNDTQNYALVGTISYEI